MEAFQVQAQAEEVQREVQPEAQVAQQAGKAVRQGVVLCLKRQSPSVQFAHEERTLHDRKESFPHAPEDRQP